MCIKLIYKNHILYASFLVYLLLSSCSQNNEDNLKNYIVTNLTKNTIRLIDEDKTYTIIVLMTPSNCHDCVIHLNEYFKSIDLKKNKNAVKLLFLTGSNSSLERRTLLNQAQSWFPAADEILFENESKRSKENFNKNSIFKFLAIQESPALVIGDGKVGSIKLTLRYEALFDAQGYVLESAKNKIKEALL